eukprot:1089457-Pyramimonas_sp.AAC.1
MSASSPTFLREGPVERLLQPFGLDSRAGLHLAGYPGPGLQLRNSQLRPHRRAAQRARQILRRWTKHRPPTGQIGTGGPSTGRQPV